MGLFKKVEETKSGLKVLVFGASATGKSTFALTFKDIVAIDSEDGLSFYKNNPNLKYILNTTSAVDLEDGLDEIEDSLIKEIKTVIIDSETKIYENLQLSGLNVAEKRATEKRQSVDSANMSFREWGKLKLINKKLQASKIMLASKGINIVSVAQEKEVKEKRGENWIVVGYTADVAKGLEYDYDIVLRLFTEKDIKTKTDLYKGEILKDRTGTYKKGQVLDNPTFENWSKVYDQKSQYKESIVDYKKDIEKDESPMSDDVDKLEVLIHSFKTKFKALDKAKQDKVLEKTKELGIGNPLKSTDADAMTEVVKFINSFIVDRVMSKL